MRLLIIRTSAMGDVALASPVIRGLIDNYPDIEIMLLTRAAFNPFFSSIDNLILFNPDFRNRHKGIPGLINLYKDIIKQRKINYVIDLHDVIRSKILRLLFRLNGVAVSVVDKGRGGKRALIKGKTKAQLKHTVERYRDAFLKAGFRVEPYSGKAILVSPSTLDNAGKIVGQQPGLNIGVAPYAKHALKAWPEKNMVHLLNLISEKRKTQFLLFGAKEESGKLELFKREVPNSINLAGRISLDVELAVMSRLNFMIAMDSSNMHMAALVGTKVVSIWGGTDPLNGFGAWMQPENYSIRIPVEELTCRPCTIYGKGSCRRGDLACMHWLSAEMVFKKIEEAGLFG